jgi:predicted NACHT family NTPase
MVDRNVLDISPNQKSDETDRSRRFSAFADHINLVLLGDPGAGKTHLFEEAAAASGGRYLTARHFMLAPVSSTNTPLFIDALDETRSGRADQDTINTFVRKLFEVVPAKVRIASRVADWLGDTDRTAFNTYFQEHGGVTELQLKALSPIERQAVLMAERKAGVAATPLEATNFLKEAERRGLEEFTLNPQNLLMLWDAVRSGGIWPKTRKELFELSTWLLLSEHNRTKQRSGVGVFTAEELRDAAGALCSMRLVSDVEGISLQESGDGADFPSYRTLSFITPEKALAGLGRRVFVAGGRSETVDYAHRTTAEFLGAGWIAAQVRRGLRLSRRDTWRTTSAPT